MSSHHIVREKQEPALLILDFTSFNEEYLGQLLEWSPTVIIPLSLFEKVMSMGIKVDAILTQEAPNLPYFQEHVKLITCDDDLLDCALKHLVSEGFPAVNIISNHFRPNEYQFYIDLIDLVIYQGDQKIYPIKSGFSKWKAVNENISLMQADLVRELSISGLKEVSDAHYKTFKDGFFSLTFENSFIFISEQL